MNGNVIRRRNHSIKPHFSHQPELLPSLILHVLIFLVGVTGHLSLLYYLHTRHIRFFGNFTGCNLSSDNKPWGNQRLGLTLFCWKF